MGEEYISKTELIITKMAKKNVNVNINIIMKEIKKFVLAKMVFANQEVIY